MYLIFDTYQDAGARNRQAIIDRDWPPGTTQKRWVEIPLSDGRVALDVGNGDGLSDAEISQCVNELPEQDV